MDRIEAKDIELKRCKTCMGLGLVAASEVLHSVGGDAYNAEVVGMRDCADCCGRGFVPEVYSAPDYTSHVPGTNKPEGIQYGRHS